MRCSDRWQTPPAPAAPEFGHEFKAQAVRLVLHDGKSVGAVARDLDLTEPALWQWVERTRADQTGGRLNGGRMYGLSGRDSGVELARKRAEDTKSALFSVFR